MDLVHRIKDLCLAKNISIPKLEKLLGFGSGAIYTRKKSSPNSDNIQKVANYFHVSIDYLLGREPNHNFYDFQFSVSRSVHSTKEDKEKLIKTFKDITNLYLDAKGK